MLQFCTF